MAGKPRYTAEQVIAALEQTKGMLFLASRVLGCSHDTVVNYIKRYPSVRQVSEQLRGELVDTAELKLWQSVQKGEQWGVTLVLKTLGKDRGYVERQEQSGPGGQAVDIRVVYEEQQQACDKLRERLASIRQRHGQAPDQAPP
jgi:hypothetical protein